jgi:hypothetical protein
MRIINLIVDLESREESLKIELQTNNLRELRLAQKFFAITI